MITKSEPQTRTRILQAAQAEFIEKGFRAASLRSIVKAAGVTTGAFYGYFESKAQLFDALVGEQYETIMARYREAQEAFRRLAPEQQHENVGEISGDCMDWMLEYMYANPVAFRLILCASDGTPHADMVDEMARIDVDATDKFIHTLQQLGQPDPKLDKQLEHILVSGMFTAFFEVIVHEMPKERAYDYMRELRAFYTAGWKQIIGF